MPANDDNVRTSWATVWVQPDGPNTVPQPLGCYNMDDISQDYGGINPIFCQDPVTPGRYRRVGITQDPPSLPTTSLEGLMGKTQDYLERVASKGCAIGLYVTFTDCPPKNVFLNYDRANVIEDAHITSGGQSPNANRDSDESAMITFDITAELQQKVFEVLFNRRATTEDQILMDIVACGISRCQGACGAAQDSCDVLYAVAQADSGVTANVLRSADAGTTWAATAADPFAADEHIASAVCVQINASTTRLIVARGSTDAGNPAEIAYSDDNGATWTAVNVGSTNAEYVLAGGGLYALDMRHIWCVTDLGNIYFSNDAGVSWSDQASGNTDDLWMIKFSDEKNGIAVGGTTATSHVLLKTVDGGAHWTAVTFTGPGATVMATSCEIIDSQRWWIGFEGGQVYYTIDGGASFAARSIAQPADAATWHHISDISLVPGDQGYILWLCGNYEDGSSNGTGVIQRSVNGGYDWETFSTVDLDATTHGLTALAVCDANQAFAVGGVATTSMIVEVVNL